MTQPKTILDIPEPPITRHSEFDPEDEYRPEPAPEPLPPSWMDGSVRIGLHTSIAGSYVNALESAWKLGANALQIFSASPRMWQQSGSSRVAEVEAKAFRARREELQLGPLVIHSNYLVNLAAAQPMLRTRSIQAFHDEIVRALALGADYLVVHPGSRGESSISQAITTIIESLKQATRRVQMGNLQILIENTAGMGSAVGSRLEEVADIVNGLRALPFAACLDTAHLFAAGYDIKSESGLASTIAQIEATIGLDRVPVFHINDSKIALGGKVDRHDHIGEGKIGPEAFQRFLQHPRLGTLPPEGLVGRAFIAETPIDEIGDDRKNVEALWNLAGLADQAPQPEKGFSMLTKAVKKKMDENRAIEKKKVAAAAREKAATEKAKKSR